MTTQNRPAWQTGRVIEVTRAADAINAITIALPQLVHPDPGAHADIRLPDGDVRSYSIVQGGADARSVTLGVRLSPSSRGGSAYMHGLTVGDEITIAAPIQNFPLRIGAPRYVLLAGGVGITATAAMAVALQTIGVDVRLVYVGRSRAAMAFVDELRARLGDRLELHVDNEGDGLDVAELIGGLDAATELYMCGPIRLMDAARREWTTRKLPVANLRFETFGNSGWFDAQSFALSVPSLGVSTTVAPSESILEALERVGADPMFDCRKGECGLCQIDVVDTDGELDHRDVFFSEPQKDSGTRICACVSRVVAGRGCSEPARLVLDAP